MVVEKAQDTVEEVTTQPEETLEVLEKPSGSESEPSGEQTEEEAKPKEGEDFESKVTSLAQKIADKSTNTITKQRDEAAAKVADLEVKLSDKMWNHEINALFGEESENLGEDVAKKNKENRAKMAANYKDFQSRDAEVNKSKAFYDDMTPKLGAIERNQHAREAVWQLLFSEDKAKLAQATALIKKFEKAEDWKDYEIILEGIQGSHKGKPFEPDGGKTAASGTRKYDPNEPSLTLQDGFKKLKSRK